MRNVLKFVLLILVSVAWFTTSVSGQGKSIKPLAENASLPETQKWLTEAIPKYGSYKSRANSVAVSAVKFDGCKLSFTTASKSGSTGHATMGATTRTYTVKEDVAFDLALVEPDGVSLEDNVFPELQTIKVRLRSASGQSTAASGDEVELVVKHDAAEQIRAALVHGRALCVPKS